MQPAPHPADQQPLLTTIQDFIREEVARQLSLLPLTNAPTPSLAPDLQQVIRAHVAESLPPMPQPPPVTAPLSYASVAARPPQQPAPYFRPVVSTHTAPTTVRAATPTYARPPAPFFRRQDSWRTSDNKPICYACGVAGHVARYCRRYPPGPYDTFAEPVPPPFRTPPRYTTDDRPPYSNRRSPSPRRRSLSPMRRRPTTEEGN